MIYVRETVRCLLAVLALCCGIAAVGVATDDLMALRVAGMLGASLVGVLLVIAAWAVPSDGNKT